MLNRRQFFSTAALAGSALAGIVPAVKAAAPAADVTTEVVPSKANPVLLNFNENSLGMAPSAKKAVADALVNGHRYPDDAKEAARAAIAKMHGVDAKQVTLGAGSSQVIQAIIASKVEAAKNAGQKVQVLEPTPTFGVAAAYFYPLSKRTQVYAGAGWTKDKSSVVKGSDPSAWEAVSGLVVWF